MLLVAQCLQLVTGFPASVAGLWMGLAALAMIVGGIGAPLVARSIRPGFVVAASLALSACGYAMLARIGGGGPDLTIAIVALALAYLGNGTIAALGTELAVGSAPREKAGSASALTEMVQDLGISVDIALLGSIAGAIYHRELLGQLPAGLDAEAREAVIDSLWAATALAAELPSGLLAQARAAFVSGLQGAALVSAAGVAVLAVLSAVALRRVGTQQDPSLRDS